VNLKLKVYDPDTLELIGYEELTCKGWGFVSASGEVPYSNVARGLLQCSKGRPYKRALFAGHKDKFEHDIYSGDYFLDETGRKGVIAWTGTKFVLQYNNKAEELTFLRARFIKILFYINGKMDTTRYQ